MRTLIIIIIIIIIKIKIKTLKNLENLVHLEMEAGDCVLFHPVLIHGSGFN